MGFDRWATHTRCAADAHAMLGSTRGTQVHCNSGACTAASGHVLPACPLSLAPRHLLAHITYGGGGRERCSQPATLPSPPPPQRLISNRSSRAVVQPGACSHNHAGRCTRSVPSAARLIGRSMDVMGAAAGPGAASLSPSPAGRVGLGRPRCEGWGWRWGSGRRGSAPHTLLACMHACMASDDASCMHIAPIQKGVRAAERVSIPSTALELRR